jgi:hypothetical protein
MMGKKPEWVALMGDAFLSDPDSVMDTVQRLRSKAEDAGTLKTSKEQEVKIQESEGLRVIIIEPAEPEVIYVPVYNPRVVYGPWWYPTHLPYYYYPHYYHPTPGVFLGFTFGIAVGNAIWGSLNWHHRDVMINVHRYNTLHIHHKIPIASRHTSWKNVVRHNHPRVLKHSRPSARDIQRQHAKKVMQSRKKLDAIYYDKTHHRDFSRERSVERPQNSFQKNPINREIKQQKRHIESSRRGSDGGAKESRGVGRSGEGRHFRQ